MATPKYDSGVCALNFYSWHSAKRKKRSPDLASLIAQIEANTASLNRGIKRAAAINRKTLKEIKTASTRARVALNKLKAKHE